jgi:hypothetical protein
MAGFGFLIYSSCFFDVPIDGRGAKAAGSQEEEKSSCGSISMRSDSINTRVEIDVVRMMHYQVLSPLFK